MINIKDLILLVVVSISMVAGVAWPEAARPIGPFLSWALMGLLFLAFLKVYPPAIWHTLRRYPIKMSMLVLIKLIVLPLLVFPIVIKFFPAYALGLLLLAGVSSGLSAPFFSGLVGANIPLVLAMTVVTTLLLPLTLPLMVKILVGREINFDLFRLAGFMLTLIFLPMLASLFFRRWLPRASNWVDEHSFAISLVLLVTINLGAFGLYAPFLREHQHQVVVSVLIGSGLGALMAGTGLILFWSSPPTERVAAAGALGWINNVLVIVLGNYFNDPLTSVVAALYLVPYYAMIIPLSHLTRILKAREDFGEIPYS
jgi:bile acid:Na+ symporter, BASS family